MERGEGRGERVVEESLFCRRKEDRRGEESHVNPLKATGKTRRSSTRRRVKPSSDQLQRKREMDSQTAVNEAVVYPPPLHFTRQGANVSTQK